MCFCIDPLHQKQGNKYNLKCKRVEIEFRFKKRHFNAKANYSAFALLKLANILAV
jgi:hypothetical protein